MQSDRELLELAAKAAGMKLDFTAGGKIVWDVTGDIHRIWNPLTDDGDNRRLQVKLRLGLVPLEGGGWDCIAWDYDGEVSLATDFDPNRAIVRAAADIAVRAHPDNKDGGTNG
ncbi:hypothetical protein ACM1PE_06740 [Achromobacter sp. PD1]|uniref:hypothetical protein n=1 Tax=Achromobacter sp. PD1 TaxID=3399125 RepID=UPI003AF7DB77